MNWEEIEKEYQSISKKNWEVTGTDDSTMSGMEAWDYEFLVRYITENKPKNIVEYGSGISTYMIDKLLTELDYGATFISFEDDPYWYEKIQKSGLDLNNRVQLVDITTHTVELTKDFTKSYIGVRYEHGYENMQETDLVLIDGPELNKLNADTTLNLHDMVNTIGYVPTYWIDGRHRTVQYYNHLGYEEHQIHARRDLYEVRKLHPELSDDQAQQYVITNNFKLK